MHVMRFSTVRVSSFNVSYMEISYMESIARWLRISAVVACLPIACFTCGNLFCLAGSYIPPPTYPSMALITLVISRSRSPRLDVQEAGSLSRPDSAFLFLFVFPNLALISLPTNTLPIHTHTATLDNIGTPRRSLWIADLAATPR